MRPLAPAVLGLLVCLIAPSSYCEGNERFPLKKQPELQQIRPKKPVRIKLKRSPKDEYSWELSGDDPDEIIRVDGKLRRQLNSR